MLHLTTPIWVTKDNLYHMGCVGTSSVSTGACLSSKYCQYAPESYVCVGWPVANGSHDNTVLSYLINPRPCTLHACVGCPYCCYRSNRQATWIACTIARWSRTTTAKWPAWNLLISRNGYPLFAFCLANYCRTACMETTTVITLYAKHIDLVWLAMACTQYLLHTAEERYNTYCTVSRQRVMKARVISHRTKQSVVCFLLEGVHNQ